MYRHVLGEQITAPVSTRKRVPNNLSAKYKIVGFLGQASVVAANGCPVRFTSVRNMGGSKAWPTQAVIRRLKVSVAQNLNSTAPVSKHLLCLTE